MEVNYPVTSWKGVDEPDGVSEVGAFEPSPWPPYLAIKSVIAQTDYETAVKQRGSTVYWFSVYSFRLGFYFNPL